MRGSWARQVCRAHRMGMCMCMCMCMRMCNRAAWRVRV